MNNITELVVEEVKIKGGSKIRVAAYKTPNKTLFNGMFFIGKLLRWLMECKSNNMTRGIQPSDIRKLWLLWDAHKLDFQTAQKNSDAPTGVLEFQRVILLPHPSEMRRYKNLKIQRVASELHDYAHACMSVDSADGVQIVDLADYKDITSAQKVCEEVMNLFVGTGKPIKDKLGAWNTGIEIPALVELGQEIPDGDLDQLAFAEPSITAPASGLPDAPDTEAGSTI